jgi:hypothetical protein
MGGVGLRRINPEELSAATTFFAALLVVVVGWLVGLRQLE